MAYLNDYMAEPRLPGRTANVKMPVMMLVCKSQL